MTHCYYDNSDVYQDDGEEEEPSSQGLTQWHPIQPGSLPTPPPGVTPAPELAYFPDQASCQAAIDPYNKWSLANGLGSSQVCNTISDRAGWFVFNS